MNDKQEVVARLIGFRLTEKDAKKVAEILEKRTKFFESDEMFDEEEEKEEYADDGFIHITRGHKRFVFYNGQEKGCFTQRDVPRFAKMVDKAIDKVLGE